jgi:SAM-dependent methyltransferase
MRLKKINSCEVCSNSKLNKVLDLGYHPLCDDLKPIGSKKKNKYYKIVILLCKKCLTAYQSYIVPKKILFPKSYHYRSRLTKDVLLGMKDLINSYIKKFGPLNNKLVIDIGCNDGSLLDFFKIKGCKTLGIEPTNAYVDAQKNHKIYNEYLSTKLTKQIKFLFKFPDIIVFTNVFAHIENLNNVINSIKELIGPKTVIIIENHYLRSILEKNQFDTFYHEHPRTYSATSFKYIANLLNLEILDIEFPKRYGGNIRVFLGASSMLKKKTNLSYFLNKEKSLIKSFANLRANVNLWKKNKKKYFSNLVNKFGPLIAKAFPGRAAILIKLLDITKKTIKCVYEKPGSPKIGHYVPGTNIPIISDRILFNLKNSGPPIINLSWHISPEIKKYLHMNNINNKIIDIVSSKDFNKYKK